MFYLKSLYYIRSFLWVALHSLWHETGGWRVEASSWSTGKPLWSHNDHLSLVSFPRPYPACVQGHGVRHLPGSDSFSELGFLEGFSLSTTHLGDQEGRPGPQLEGKHCTSDPGDQDHCLYGALNSKGCLPPQDQTRSLSDSRSSWRLGKVRQPQQSWRYCAFISCVALFWVPVTRYFQHFLLSPPPGWVWGEIIRLLRARPGGSRSQLQTALLSWAVTHPSGAQSLPLQNGTDKSMYFPWVIVEFK